MPYQWLSGPEHTGTKFQGPAKLPMRVPEPQTKETAAGMHTWAPAYVKCHCQHSGAHNACYLLNDNSAHINAVFFRFLIKFGAPLE